MGRRKQEIHLLGGDGEVMTISLEQRDVHNTSVGPLDERARVEDGVIEQETLITYRTDHQLCSRGSMKAFEHAERTTELVVVLYSG